MLDTALGFSLIVSTLITLITYIATRGKNKTEEEQKDKFNDMIILFVICFTVTIFGKICMGDSKSVQTSLVKVSDTKGGQCPF